MAMLEGSPADGRYGNYGVGNSTAVFREATVKGRFPSDNTGPGRSTGETPGAGSVYAAMLTERPNLSFRDGGPEGTPSRSATSPIPVMTMASRATGRISGV